MISRHFTASMSCRPSRNPATTKPHSTSSAHIGAPCWTLAQRRFGKILTCNGPKTRAPIDQLIPPGKRDIHGDCGAHCYVGFRHSLCHGWASGPTAWLSQHVLGVEPLEPGFARVRVVPNLGDLNWVEGKYPTPKGPLIIHHKRLEDGEIQSTVEVPEGIEVVYE